jgi:hypothetical protein
LQRIQALAARTLLRGQFILSGQFPTGTLFGFMLLVFDRFAFPSSSHLVLSAGSSIIKTLTRPKAQTHTLSFMERSAFIWRAECY